MEKIWKQLVWRNKILYICFQWQNERLPFKPGVDVASILTM